MATGTPKLLDFGIAKLLNPELAHDTLATINPTADYAKPGDVQGETFNKQERPGVSGMS